MAHRLAYSIREAAEALGVSQWPIREECNRSEIDYVKFGSRKLIPLWSLEKRLGRPLDDRDDAAEMPADF